jgi:hypothetical protein
VSTVAPGPDTSSTREFLLGVGVAFVTMLVVVLATLYLLGGFQSDTPAAAVGPRVYTAEDLTPAPKPTAVWKFRQEWLKPSDP